MQNSRRNAFSLIELLVAITILAVLSVLVITNLSKARSNARDGRRKNDIQEYSTALEKYRLTKGSAYLGAVGAESLSYGRLNYKGSATNGGKSYATTSTLGEALQAAGVIGQPAKDPQGGTAAGSRDYVLVRCDAAGNKATGTADAYVAVWAALENVPGTVDVSNSQSYCGGSKVGATVPAEFASDSMAAPTSANTESNLKYTAFGNSRIK